MPLPSARLDRRLTLLRPVQTRGELNETITTFEPEGDPLWAGKRDVGGAERMRAAETGAVVDVRFIVRAIEVPAEFDATWRLRAELRLGTACAELDVVSVIEAEQAWGQRLRPGEALEISARARAEQPQATS